MHSGGARAARSAAPRQPGNEGILNMGKQVLTVAPGGALSGLQRRRGDGLDLTRMGRARVERASLVEWEEMMQGWTITPLVGPTRGVVLTIDEFARAHGARRVAGGSALVFSDYETAVAAEVQYLDALRLRGEL